MIVPHELALLTCDVAGDCVLVRFGCINASGRCSWEGWDKDGIEGFGLGLRAGTAGPRDEALGA